VEVISVRRRKEIKDSFYLFFYIKVTGRTNLRIHHSEFALLEGAFKQIPDNSTSERAEKAREGKGGEERSRIVIYFHTRAATYCHIAGSDFLSIPIIPSISIISLRILLEKNPRRIPQGMR
jgi:hypothetical protein